MKRLFGRFIGHQLSWTMNLTTLFFTLLLPFNLFLVPGSSNYFKQQFNNQHGLYHKNRKI
jgi:hypothetical protein